MYVPYSAEWVCDGGGGGGGGGGSSAAGCRPCGWRATPGTADPYTGLQAVELPRQSEAWRRCEAEQRLLCCAGRKPRLPARRVYWMWGGRVRFGLLPADRFLQGPTYFVYRLHEQRAVPPLHVHVTYTMGGGEGKRSRLRAAGLWQAPHPRPRRPPDLPLTALALLSRQAASRTGAHAAGSAAGDFAGGAGFVRVTGLDALLLSLLDRMRLPPKVWECDPPPTDAERERGHLPDQPSAFFALEGGAGSASRCYHPRHLVLGGRAEAPPAFDYARAPDPAAPHVAMQYVQRSVLRNALALASALGWQLVRPRLWALCERHWWHLKDCRLPGNPLPMPYDAPYDTLFNLEDWNQAGAEDGAAAGPIQLAEEGEVRGLEARRLHLLPPSDGGGGAAGGSVEGDLVLPHGTSFDAAARFLRPRLGNASGGRRAVVELDVRSLLRFSPCGFDDEAAAARFQRRVVERLFRGQYSYCGEERNPHVDAMLANARAKHQPEEPLLMTRRNCTGQPANDFNKPKVDLGPEALRYLPRGACGERTVGGGSDDGAEATLKRGVAFVRLS